MSNTYSAVDSCISHSNTSLINTKPTSLVIINLPKHLKFQPVLFLSSFMRDSSINEHKKMKLRENICYERLY